MNNDKKLAALRSTLASALTVVDAILSDGNDDALESGAAGSGRFRKRSGHTTADLASETAEHASRIATRDNTVAGHVKAADLHTMAADEFDAAGMYSRANDHREKSHYHTRVAKTVQEADQIHATAGRQGSEASYSDKTAYGDVRRENLDEGGGPAGGDHLAQKRPDGQVECPMCKFLFMPEDSVSGKNIPETTCPRCSGIFRTETGTPSEE